MYNSVAFFGETDTIVNTLHSLHIDLQILKGSTSKLLQTYWLTFKNFKSNENVFAFKQLKLDIPLNNGIFRWVLGCFSQLVSPIELKWTYTELICAPPMPNLECNVRFLCKCIIGIGLLTYRVFWSASKKASFNDDILSWLCLTVFLLASMHHITHCIDSWHIVDRRKDCKL